MKRVIQTIPHPSSRTYNATDKRIYTRFHRKPQANQTTIQSNKSYRKETTLEQEGMNDFISKMYKKKKYCGILDPTAPNNKNIFVETDSDYHKSDRYIDDYKKNHYKKSTQLLIAKTESQFPETYNSQNIFRRDGLVRGYYIKVNQNKRDQINNAYNTISNERRIRTIIQTPTLESEDKILYDFNKGAQTQIRQKKIENTNYLNQTYNRNSSNKEYFKKEIDLDEWPSIEKTQRIIYERNNNMPNYEKEIKTDNSNETENQNQNTARNQAYNKIIYQKQRQKYPSSMIFNKRNISDMKPSNSKSNISEISEDFINVYKRQQMKENENNQNYIIAGNASEIASPNKFKQMNEMAGTSEEDSEKQAELIFYNENDYQSFMNKKIIRTDFNNNNIIENDQGGKVDLYYGIMNNKKDLCIKNKHVITKKKITVITIEDIIRNDEIKMNLIIKLQRFFKSYLYLRELCAMKIQAIWRGRNTRKIMDLYNDLDEFIYHLSKVQFNHFNNNFCFFIRQLFNIYKANVSNGNYDENDNDIQNENNEEEENEDENENCMDQISLDEIEQKGDMRVYSYKFPDGVYFDQEKLTPENEIDLFVEGSPSPYIEKKYRKKSKEYERLMRDYDELYQQYNELRQKNNIGSNNLNIKNHIYQKREKNESESTIGSNKSDYKFRKIDKYNSVSRENSKNNKAFSDKRRSTGDNGKNLTFSNDYDADLDINRDDDFFNQEISYDDKDNSGFLMRDKKFSYFSIHSDENSKYFDNENPKDREREVREGEIYKINISKNSGTSKVNNSSKYTRSSSRQGQSKLLGLPRYDKSSKNYSQSPSFEKSNNYMGHHSKTFPRKYKNYNDVNNILIIPKHEEDFNIINTNMFLSPKGLEDKTNIKNIRTDIAITPNIKLEDKNWNEIIEFIKNEEIEIPTQRNIEKKNQTQIQPKETKEISTQITSELYLYENQPITNEQFYLKENSKKKEKMPYVLENNVAKVNIIKNKIYKKPRRFMVRKNEEINIEGIEKNKVFKVLEKENNNELNIDRKDFMKIKLDKIYVQHENQINIFQNQSKKNEIKEKSLIKEIEEKNNEISLLKKELEEIKNMLNKPKVFEEKLEINKNLNSINLDGIKHEYNEILIKSGQNNSEEELELNNEKEKINSLLEEKIKKEKNWNNLVINKNKKIELNPEKNIIIKKSDLIKNFNTLKEEKLQKEKEWNNLVINKNKNIELKEIENIQKKSELKEKLNKLIEKNIQKEKEWSNLVVSKRNNIQINQIENIDINDLDLEILLKANENLKSLIQERDNNNLIIDNVKTIELKGNKNEVHEKESQLISKEINIEIKEKAKNKNMFVPILNEEFIISNICESKELYKNILEIQSFSFDIDKEDKEKAPILYNEVKTIQLNLEGKNKSEKDLNKNMMSNENQLFIKGMKRIYKAELTKDKNLVKDKIYTSEDTQLDENEQKLRNVYKKPLKAKEVKDNNIDKCIQFNIERIYENKNISQEDNRADNSNEIKEKKVEEKDKLEDKNKKEELNSKEKRINLLQPEEQSNNRFSVINTIKTKDNIEINKNKLLEITKNEEINLSKKPKDISLVNESDKVNIEENKSPIEREIKISTKKVYRKNIIHNKFKNNSIVSENNLFIKSIEKAKLKPILEEESQDNIKLTIKASKVQTNKLYTLKDNINDKEKESKDSNITHDKNEELKEEREKEENKLKEEEKLDNDLQSKKIQTIENCIQFNIDRIYDNKKGEIKSDIEKEKEGINIIEKEINREEISDENNLRNKNLLDKLKPEEQNNNRFTVISSTKTKEKVDKAKESEKEKKELEKENIILTDNKVPSEREIKISTKKVYRKNIIRNKFKNISINSESQISINRKEKNKIVLEEDPQNNNRFTVEKVIKENKEIDNLEHNKEKEDSLNKNVVKDNENNFENEKTKGKDDEDKVINEQKSSENLQQNESKDKEPKEEDKNEYKKMINKDNCIHFNIDRIYENKNILLHEDNKYNKKEEKILHSNEKQIESKVEEIKDKEDKNIGKNFLDNKEVQKIFIQLEPEKQENNSFTVINKENKKVVERKEVDNQVYQKEKDKILDNSKDKLKLEIIKNEEINIYNKTEETNKPIEREIKISTKKVIRKNIIHKTFNNNSITSENKLNINGTEKKRTFAETEPQDNIRFTIDKIIAEKKENNLEQNKIIDNCIRIHIDETLENKNNVSLKDKDGQNEEILNNKTQKKFIQLIPEEQNNNRFSLFNISNLEDKALKQENKLKENEISLTIISNKPKDLLLEISKNEEININTIKKEEINNEKPIKKEIKITTKKVFRKNIILNKLKNNSIITENNLSIIGQKKKEKTILEKEPQDNNRFTVENILKEKKTIEKVTLNLDNCIQFNIEKISEEKSDKLPFTTIQKEFNQLKPEEQNNNRFTILKTEKELKNIPENINQIEIIRLYDKKDIKLEIIKNEEININKKSKEEIFTINNNNSIILEGQKIAPSNKEIKITTKKTYKKNIKINQFKNDLIISNNQINIKGKERLNPIKEVVPQESIRFTIENIIVQNKETKEINKDNINEGNAPKQNKYKDKNEINVLDQETQEIPMDDLQHQKPKNIQSNQLSKDIDNCIQFNIDRIYSNKNDNKALLEKVNNEEVNISKKPKEKISLIIKNDEFSIEKNKDNVDTMEKKEDEDNFPPKEIKITTKKVIKKINSIQYKFKNVLISSEKELNIIGKERTKQSLEQESIENNRFSIGKSFEEEKEEIKEDKKYIPFKQNEEKDDDDSNKEQNNQVNEDDKESIQGENDKNKSVLRAKKVINPEELKITQSISYNITQDEEKMKQKINELISTNKRENMNKSLEIVKNEEVKFDLIPKEPKREIKIVTKKVLKKTNNIYTKFNNNKSIISLQHQFDIKGIEKKLNNKISNENNIVINSNGKKFDRITIQNEEDKNNNNRFTIQKYSNIILFNKLKQIESQTNVSFEVDKTENIKIEKPLEILKIDSINLNNEKDIEEISKEQIEKLKKIKEIQQKEKNVINVKSQFTIKGIVKSPKENIINSMVKFTINKSGIKAKDNIINTKNRFTIVGVHKKINENIINTKSQFTINRENKKPKDYIINSKSQFSICGKDKASVNNIINSKYHIYIKGLNKKLNDNIINSISKFTINRKIKKQEENIINTKSIFSIIGKDRKQNDNIINSKSQFTIKGINKRPQANIINSKSQFEIKGKEKLEKTTDTTDLIRKEIKITTKKIIKTTNILKSKRVNPESIICSEKQLDIIGNQRQISEKGFNKDKLIKDMQQNKFIIKKSSIKKTSDELIIQNFELILEEKENSNLINANKYEEKDYMENKDWNKILKEDIQQNKFIIKKTKKVKKEDKKDIKEDLKLKDEKNIKIKEVTINIKGEENQKNILIDKLLTEKMLLRNEDWNKSLKEDIQQNKFIIKRISKNIYSKLSQLQSIEQSEKEKEKIELIDENNNKKEDNNKLRDYKDIINEESEVSDNKKKNILNWENQRNVEWNKSLKIDGQQYNFLIKRISKNIYSKINKLNSIKDEEKEKINDDKKDEIQKEKLSKKENKENNWNEILKEDIQQEQFIIESREKNKQEMAENTNILKSMKNNVVKDNIIVKKIDFNIISNKYNPLTQSQTKYKSELLSKDNLPKKNIWINSLKEDIQQSKFIIKKIKNNKGKLERINKSKIEIYKNTELDIEPTNDLPIDKNKIIENWKKSITKQKSEEINIEKQPKMREIKITTKKIVKTTNNKYRNFNKRELKITTNDLYLYSQPENKIKNYSIETSQVTLNIPKSYPQKSENLDQLIIEKNKELVINPEENIKKEIKITTKRRISKTNYVFKRFTSNFITKENELKLKGKKRKIFAFNSKILEKNDISENNFTIEKTIDNKLELELKEKLDKEIEEIKEKVQKESEDKLKEGIKKISDELENKMKKENEEIKEKLIKENDELKNKIQKEADEQLQEKIKKEVENLKIKLKDEEEILKEKYNEENEELKTRLIKEKEEIKEQLEKEKNDLKKENEELKTKLDNEENTRKEEQENKIKNNKPILNEEFTIKNNQNDLKEKKIDKKETNKKQIIITTKKILKKTNILKHSFKNNSIYKDNTLKLVIPKIKTNQKDNIINKIKSFSINKTDKISIKDINTLEIRRNKDIFIKNDKNKNLEKSIIINKVSNIQLFNDKLHQSYNITENTFGDKTQLYDDKMQKSIIEITDPNKNVSEFGKIHLKNESETNKSASKIEENYIESETLQVKSEGISACEVNPSLNNEYFESKKEIKEEENDSKEQKESAYLRLKLQDKEEDLKEGEKSKKLQDKKIIGRDVNESQRYVNAEKPKEYLTEVDTINNENEEEIPPESYKKLIKLATKGLNLIQIINNNKENITSKSKERYGNVSLDTNDMPEKEKDKDKNEELINKDVVDQEQFKDDKEQKKESEIKEKENRSEINDNDKILEDTKIEEKEEEKNPESKEKSRRKKRRKKSYISNSEEKEEEQKDEKESEKIGQQKEEDKKIYSKKTIAKRSKKQNNRNKKLKALVIDLHNKKDLQKCFKNWNNMIPNSFILNENKKMVNIKQVSKDKNIIKKHDFEDNNKIELNNNEQKTIQHMKDSNIGDINNKKEENAINLNDLESKNIICEEKENKDKLNLENKEKKESENKEKTQGLKKREIRINKKITIISKPIKKITKCDEVKTKFLEKRNLIKFWKIWKKKSENKPKGKEGNIIDIKLEDEKIAEDKKKELKNEEEEKSNKKPFILKINKVSIKKRVLEIPRAKKINKRNNEIQEKILLLRNKIIDKHRTLLIRHFFTKWKKESENERNIIQGVNIMHRIMTRYIVRYLVMHGKIMKFKPLLIKYALNRNKYKSIK